MANWREQYGPLIEQYAKQYGVSPRLITQIIQQESGGDPNARAKGSSATGLGQMTLATAKDLGFSDEDRTNPEKSIEMIAKNLSQKIKYYNGDESKAILAYNQGIGGANAILKGTATPKQMKEGNAYLNSNNFTEFVDPSKKIANPVSDLPQQQPPLQGAALLQAQPQTMDQATQGADMGAGYVQQQNQNQQISPDANYNMMLQTYQQMQQHDQDAQQAAIDQKKAKKDSALKYGIMATLSMLADRGKINQTVQQGEAPRSAGVGLGAPTAQNIQSLRGVGLSGGFTGGGQGWQ